MSACLLVQPIHSMGVAALTRAGFEARISDTTDMVSVGRQASDCAAVITRNAGFSESAIAQAQTLRVIGVHGVGVDPVAVSAATKAGICVVNTPLANVQSVAEHTLALIFALAKQITNADHAVRKGDFRFKYGAGLVELSGLTLGLVGFGNIGQATARLASGLGMNVVAYSPSKPDEAFQNLKARRVRSLGEVLAVADVVSLHLPLSASTRGIIGRREIRLMKPTAFLINTSRGAILDEAALIEALEHGSIAGAGLDVYASESMDRAYPLLHLRNVVLTPHSAGSTEACLARTALDVVEQVIAVLADRSPRHLVNPEVWSHRRRA